MPAAEIYCCGRWIDYPTPGNDTQCPVCFSVFHVKEDEQLMLPLDVHVDEPIAKVLGQDDWLFYARTDSGRLVYWNSESSPAWFSAPHGGFHDCNCPDSMAVCRIDASWMQLYVERNKNVPGLLYWQNGEGVEFHNGPWITDPSHCDFNEALGWPESKDLEFVVNSRKAYLCD